MRILQLNCVYGNGSTGKLVESNSRILRSLGHDVLTLYTSPPDTPADPTAKRVCTKAEHLFNSARSRIDGIPFGGIFLSNRRIYREIRRFSPDVVHVHCVNGNGLNIYRLLRHLGRHRIKTVVTLHAEFFHTGSCTHACDCEQWHTECRNCAIYKAETGSIFFNRANKAWRLMRDAFAAFNPADIIVTAVSPWLQQRARQSAILKGLRVEYVPNGVNTSVFHHRPRPQLPAAAVGTGKPILFVTPYFSLDPGNLKGGFFIPEIARRLPDTRFLIIATRQGANIGPLPENVTLLGRAESQDQLADLYSAASLTLMLSIRETFSMVTAESLCCGTPVVGFKAGGPESIALPAFTDFVTYGDLDTLIHRIAKRLDSPISGQSVSDLAIATYSEAAMSTGYEKIYHQLTDEKA